MTIKKTLTAALLGSAMLAMPAKAEEFKFAFQGDASTMDPHGLFETFTLGFQRNIYEGLVARNGDMEMVGALAESWENTKPNVWTFNLRKGVKFHNGNDMKADDVEFSVKRINSEGSDMKTVAALIKDVKVVDDYTVELHTPCLLYTSPSPRDRTRSRMPSSA